MILIEKKTTSVVSAKRHGYVARLAQTRSDISRAQRLRFEVFNLELNEGLAESHFNGLDVDPFDAVCDHLIVEHVASGDVVGTYRLQTGESARANLGYYSEQEFDFAPYELLRPRMIELGRACVRADHRTFNVLQLLWRGIALYAREHDGQFLIGCSSLTSQDPADGEREYQRLQDHLVDPLFRTTPWPEFSLSAKAAKKSPHSKTQARTGAASGGHVLECGEDSPLSGQHCTPCSTGASARLLRAYLTIGAKICGPPALDREFGTIDFLTLLDLEALPGIVRAHFFR